jgi:hypothetical protein
MLLRRRKSTDYYIIPNIKCKVIAEKLSAVVIGHKAGR